MQLFSRPNGLLPTGLFCPWDFAGKNTGVGCPLVLQGIFLTQGSDLHRQADSLPLGKPIQALQFSSSVVSDSLRHHEPQHARPPCPSPTPRVYPDSCPLSQWCHPTISSSVVPFSSCPQPFPASGSFQMSQLFASGGQSVGVSASTSVLPVNAQDWSKLQNTVTNVSLWYTKNFYSLWRWNGLSEKSL